MRWPNPGLRALFPILLLTIVSACSDTASEPPLLEPQAAVQPDSRLGRGESAAPDRWSAASEDELKPLLESEKARIAAAQEASKPDYDDLKALWESYKKANDKQTTPFLYCDPLQYAADTKIIGPEGGDMSIGPHKLSIPKGALTSYTVITGEMPVTLTVEVRLSPEGLQFEKQPTLMLSYKHCEVPAEHRYRMAYVGADGQILEWPVSYDEKKAKELFGWIWHFSRYVVVAN